MTTTDARDTRRRGTDLTTERGGWSFASRVSAHAASSVPVNRRCGESHGPRPTVGSSLLLVVTVLHLTRRASEPCEGWRAPLIKARAVVIAQGDGKSWYGPRGQRDTVHTPRMIPKGTHPRLQGAPREESRLHGSSPRRTERSAGALEPTNCLGFAACQKHVDEVALERGPVRDGNWPGRAR